MKGKFHIILGVAFAFIVVASFTLVMHPAWAADATKDGDSSTSAPITVSMTATVKGKLRITYTCPTGDGVTATDGATDAMTLAFGNVDSFPDDDFSGTLQKSRVDADGGAYWFVDCVLNTKISGGLGTTATVKANHASVVGGMSPRLVMQANFAASYDS